jgi:hypothetical protein
MHIHINFIYATVVIITYAGMRQLLVGKCGQQAVWEKVPSKLPCLENVSWGTAMWFSGTKYDSYTYLIKALDILASHRLTSNIYMQIDLSDIILPSKVSDQFVPLPFSLYVME